MNRKNVTLDKKHPAAVTAAGLMAVSAVIRLLYYLFCGGLSGGETVIHLILPLSAAVLFILSITVNGKFLIPFSVFSVVLGIVFFIAKAQTFTPIHRNLCTLLYITVLLLYTLTVTGIIPTVKLLYPLFGLPLFYHIFVEDMQLYVFSGVPFVHWLPEISVLCIMAALLAQAIAFRMEDQRR